MVDATQFLSESDNIQRLNDQVIAKHLPLFQNFRHNQLDPGYISKIYIVYTPNGSADPTVLGQIKIKAWRADDKQGPQVQLEDLTNGITMWVGMVPTRVFDYDVFFSCPPYSKLRMDGKEVGDKVLTSILFSVTIKTESRAESNHDDHIYCQPLKSFRNFFPNFKLTSYF